MPDAADRQDAAPVPRALVLDAADNVCMPCSDVARGDVVQLGGGRRLRARQDVPLGHKIALTAIAAGERVVKGGVPIGTATQAIAPGDHVHVRNLRSDYLPTYTLKDGSRLGGDGA